MKKILFFLCAATLFVLTACGNQETQKKKDNTEKNNEPIAIKAELDVPEQADLQEAVHLKTTVTQGKEKVKDADKVSYEIWEDGKKKDSKMVEANNNKDGTYTAETAFDQSGTYIVQVHVDARDMHTMPKKELTVGQPGDTDHEHEHHKTDTEDHHHTENFSMYFSQPETIKKNEDIALTVHAKLDGKALEKANVRFEIWKDSADAKHEWSEAKETKAGAYEAVHRFADTGVYHIQIHIENDKGLHEHEVHEVTVK